MNNTKWQGCYDDNWRGLIVDDAFAHPAKMARGLVVRIFDYLFAGGYLKRGGLVVDPFGGIATTAIEGASRGCRVVCCELEPKFVELGRKNLDLHRRTWEACGDPLPLIVQGDSRRLLEVVGPVLVECVVGSPPFCSSLQNDRFGQDRLRILQAAIVRDGKGHGGQIGPSVGHTYGTTQGQLGAMPPGDVADVIVSSPPYSETKVTEDRNFIGGGGNETAAAGCKQGYGQTPGQLANLPPGSVADAVVGSPPFEGSINDGAEHSRMHERYPGWGKNVDGSNRMAKSVGQNYGCTEGQLGQEQGQTFWSAARTIVQQSFAILKPGGIAVWICKDFVRKGKRVQFSDDWRKLCEACGFELVEWIHASLVKETVQDSLFGDPIVTKKEKKSFFRRLCEKKGSPRIDHEDVLVFRKA